MLHAELLDRVRERVRNAFISQGLNSFDDFAETILIRDGFYCGRCFLSGGLRAVWFIEENLIKFFGRDNALLCSEPVTEGDHGTETLVA